MQQKFLLLACFSHKPYYPILSRSPSPKWVILGTRTLLTLGVTTSKKPGHCKPATVEYKTTPKLKEEADRIHGCSYIISVF